MKPSWQKLHSSVAYRHPYWQVRKDRVVKPDGSRGYYYYVELLDFVSVIPLTADRKSTYLVRQWRYPLERNSWEFPMGIMEPGERPLEAAKRELEEEAGLKARQWRRLGKKVAVANGLTNQWFYVFLAQRLGAGTQQLESGERDMIVKKFSLRQVESMIKRGIITDAPTLVSFYWLKTFFKV